MDTGITHLTQHAPDERPRRDAESRVAAGTWHMRQRSLVEQSLLRSSRPDTPTHRRWA